MRFECHPTRWLMAIGLLATFSNAEAAVKPLLADLEEGRLISLKRQGGEALESPSILVEAQKLFNGELRLIFSIDQNRLGLNPYIQELDGAQLTIVARASDTLKVVCRNSESVEVPTLQMNQWTYGSMIGTCSLNPTSPDKSLSVDAFSEDPSAYFEVTMQVDLKRAFKERLEETKITESHSYSVDLEALQTYLGFDKWYQKVVSDGRLTAYDARNLIKESLGYYYCQTPPKTLKPTRSYTDQAGFFKGYGILNTAQNPVRSAVWSQDCQALVQLETRLKSCIEGAPAVRSEVFRHAEDRVFDALFQVEVNLKGVLPKVPQELSLEETLPYECVGSRQIVLDAIPAQTVDVTPKFMVLR